MARQTTMIMPTTKGNQTVTGQKMRLYVGNVQEEFFVHDTESDGEILSHYPSGMRVGCLNPIKLRHGRSYYMMKNRAAAEELIKDIVARNGVDAVRSKLRAAFVLNS